MTQTRDSRPSDLYMRANQKQTNQELLEEIRDLLKEILKEVSHRNAT